jgi:hypothetical protein
MNNFIVLRQQNFVDSAIIPSRHEGNRSAISPLVRSKNSLSQGSRIVGQAIHKQQRFGSDTESGSRFGLKPGNAQPIEAGVLVSPRQSQFHRQPAIFHGDHCGGFAKFAETRGAIVDQDLPFDLDPLPNLFEAGIAHADGDIVLTIGNQAFPEVMFAGENKRIPRGSGRMPRRR